MGVQLAQVVRRLVKAEWGGIETAVMALSSELEKRAHPSKVFTNAIGMPPGMEKIGLVEIERFRYVLPWLFLRAAEKEAFLKKGGSPFSFRLFLSLLFKKGLTHIHAHNLHRVGGIARTVARLRGLPYIVTLHSGYFTLPLAQKEAMKKHFAKRFEWGKCFDWILGTRRVILDADAIICVSREELQVCKEMLPEKRLFYLPNGVDLTFFTPEKRARKKKILSVARIDPQKNQWLLIQAFYEFVAVHPEYTLELIGSISDKNYYNLILEEINRLNLTEKVTIVPGLASDDPRLKEAYNSSDFFVLASIHEPFGIVLLEAWAMQCPVIAAKVGGITGFTEDEKTALLFETKEELVEKMKSLAADEEKKERLRQAATIEVQEYSWSRITDRLLAIYESL